MEVNVNLRIVIDDRIRHGKPIKYNLRTVILFGSCVDREDPNDSDIGIKGIVPELFFKFYGKLLLEITMPLDVVNLDKDNPFNKLIEKEGIKLYG